MCARYACDDYEKGAKRRAEQADRERERREINQNNNNNANYSSINLTDMTTFQQNNNLNTFDN